MDIVLIWVFSYCEICSAVKAQAPDKAPAPSGSSFNQILGIKGAKQETVSLLSFWIMIMIIIIG